MGTYTQGDSGDGAAPWTVVFFSVHRDIPCTPITHPTHAPPNTQARDPIPQFRKYMLDNKIFTEEEIKAIDKEVEEIVEESVRFAEESPKPDRGQLLENVFADPKGFGIGADGQYRYLAPGFSSGTAEVS